MRYIKKFSEISREDIKEVGGKGASLGELTRAGIPVPPGFVVTSNTFKEFVDSELPADIIEEIYKAFDNLGAERVAVRSSAIAEDSKSASWAGQLESFLNTPRGELIENIRRCWNSIRSERALSYATSQSVEEEDLLVAVVVQKMVNSDSSGVMFTVNPISKIPNELMIEGGFGLGDLLVQGMITPDNFLVDKNTLEIISRDIQTQEIMLVYKDGKNQEVEVSEDIRDKAAISEEEVKKLAEIGKRIEEHYKAPQDIEWAIEDEKIYIVQSRPITTL